MNLINQNTDVGKVTQTIPLRRFGKPEEFGETAAFLCSERASYISGAAIPVDGLKGIDFNHEGHKGGTRGSRKLIQIKIKI